MSEADWAWAAGLFEGEGCIHHRHRFSEQKNRSWTVRTLMLEMCDEDVVRRFHRVVAGGMVRLCQHPTQPRCSDSWRWYCSRWPDTERILTSLLPYLGERRRQAALELLDDPPKFVHGATHCHRGHEFSAENTRHYNGRRHCLACRRLNTRAYRERNRDKLKAYHRDYYLQRKEHHGSQR